MVARISANPLLAGRNGGHLIAGVLGDFRQRVELYGKDDALRSIAIENYTVSTILRLVDKYDLAPAIELQHGGFFWVFDSADERHTIEAEWNAVIEAGGDLPDLCVYEASWMEKVRPSQQYCTIAHAYDRRSMV